MCEQRRESAFQFHIGSIKGFLSRKTEFIINEFQFHIGSIKGKIDNEDYAIALKFQFHIGSIKGLLTSRADLLNYYFNSTLVRLKERQKK